MGESSGELLTRVGGQGSVGASSALDDTVARDEARDASTLDTVARAPEEPRPAPDSGPGGAPTVEVARQPAALGEAETVMGDAPSFTPRDEAGQLRRGATIDRYIILGTLGAGGMGVVYAAYDPELDRKVALKLLRAGVERSDAARVRLYREAQALAQLAHPNVVAVHDVGTHDGQVWLAMEFVVGETLGDWIRRVDPGWKQVLSVMLQSGRGVAAAHRSGLLHRDLKPDNIMVGADGRVRVMDFGLARVGRAGSDEEAPEGPARALSVELTADGAIMGTPAYMAPEQFMGLPADERTDQFSLCATLWMALFRQRAFAGETFAALRAAVVEGAVRAPPADARVPRWLRAVVERGLAREPAERHASVEALLSALAADPTRRRWTLGVSLGVLASAALVFGSLQLRRARVVAACEDAGASIEAVWGDDARARVREGVLATGLEYAPVTAERVMPHLDEQAAAWREHRTRACLGARVDATLDRARLDRALWCLEARRVELGALVTELARADATVVQRAVSAAAGLAPVSICTNEQVIAALPEPPVGEQRARAARAGETLSRARALLATGRYGEGLERARAALRDAEEVGWPPLTAAARELEGALLSRRGAFAESEAASVAAYMEASRVRAWAIAAAAARALAKNVGYDQARHAEGRVWAQHAEVAGALAGDPMGLDEVARLSNLGLILYEEGAYADAKEMHARALRLITEVLGEEHPTVATVLNNVAITDAELGHLDEARATHARALAVRERALGAEHPDVAESLQNLAYVNVRTGEFGVAKGLYQRALSILRGTKGPEHRDTGMAHNGLAAAHHDLGEHAEARVHYERAIAIARENLGPKHPLIAAARNNLAMLLQDMGELAEARAQLEQAVAILEATGDASGPRLGYALGSLADVERALGERAAAKQRLERAIEILGRALGTEHPEVARSLQELGRLEQELGELDAAERRYTRARALLEQAVGADHPSVASVIGDLGELALARGEPAAAVRLLERAAAVYRAHEGAHAREPGHRLALARALAKVGERERALAEARALADGHHGVGDRGVARLAEITALIEQLEDPAARP